MHGVAPKKLDNKLLGAFHLLSVLLYMGKMEEYVIDFILLRRFKEYEQFSAFCSIDLEYDDIITAFSGVFASNLRPVR